MTIRFVCTKCQKRLKVAARHAGASVKCPRCGARLTVPAESVTQKSSEKYEPPPVDEAALRFATIRPSEQGDVDMTPMVDVTFLLLIFFMVTAAFALQKSIELPTRDTSEAASQSRSIEDFEQDDDFVIVRVGGDDTIWVEDSEAPTDQQLLLRLRELRRGRGLGGARGPNRLLVLAHGDARHETVVRALDAGTAVGMEQIRLATVEEEDF